jgi:hypothetical protein
MGEACANKHVSLQWNMLAMVPAWPRTQRAQLAWRPAIQELPERLEVWREVEHNTFHLLGCELNDGVPAISILDVVLAEACQLQLCPGQAGNKADSDIVMVEVAPGGSAQQGSTGAAPNGANLVNPS